MIIAIIRAVISSENKGFSVIVRVYSGTVLVTVFVIAVSSEAVTTLVVV